MGESARYRIDLAYRGTSFHGFAAQPDQRTVAGELASALSTMLRLDEPPLITCAGRTDSGVHATAQVVHVDLPEPMPEGRDGTLSPEQVHRGLNKLLPSDVAVVALHRASPDFDARHSARWRRYRYLVLESDVPDPLSAELAWQVPGPLDVRAMHQGLLGVLGSHDFRAFCRRPPGTTADQPIVRLVTDASVRAVPASGAVDLARGRLIRVELQASSFCHQMVRSIVGQVVDIGRGRSTAADLVGLLGQGSREGAAQPAPSHGLCLVGVGYDELAQAASGLPGSEAGA